MRKQVFQILTGVLAVAICGCWSACSDDDKDGGSSLERLKTVAIPDFFFYSNEVRLGSTFDPGEKQAGGTFDTRAEAEEVKLQIDEQLLVENNVNVKLTVAEDDDEFRAMKKWDVGEYRAAKLTIQLYTATDVMVFLPAKSEHFCYNGRGSLETVARNIENMESVRPSSLIDSKLKIRYGDATMSCLIGPYLVDATVSYGETEDGVEGLEVLVTGVTKSLLKYLSSSYQDGLEVWVWCYFRNSLTRADMRSDFNEGATVTFSKKPEMYGNLFTYVRNYPYKVYAQEDPQTGVMTPYKDEGFTEKLEQKYWVHPAQDDGTPSPDYLMLCHKYEWDCTVAYTDCEYAKVLRNNADVPEDVTSKFYVIPNNYNVFYFDELKVMSK